MKASLLFLVWAADKTCPEASPQTAEKPTKPQFRGEATSPGTCSFVPPVAGFILAAHVLRTILEVPEQ